MISRCGGGGRGVRVEGIEVLMRRVREVRRYCSLVWGNHKQSSVRGKGEVGVVMEERVESEVGVRMVEWWRRCWIFFERRSVVITRASSLYISRITT